MTSAYTVSEAARLAGATVHQVRTYVASGLVKPCATTTGGYLLFNDRCVSRLRLIAAATGAGLRIAEIGILVKALENNDQRAVVTARHSVAAAIDTRQSALQKFRELLSGECVSGHHRSIPNQHGYRQRGQSER